MIPMTDSIRRLPKAELHVHTEATPLSEEFKELAVRNNIVLAEGLFTPDGKTYQYDGFHDVVTRVYDGVSQAIRTREDYADITYNYLRRCAEENTIYVEMIAWCAGARKVGLSYQDMIDGMVDGIERAKRDFGIESRINTTLLRRNFTNPEDTWSDVHDILSYPHPAIVGIDLAGGEKSGDIALYAPMIEYLIANFPRPLGVRLHAGEAAGPENVWRALSLMPPPSRLGHGVRSIESPDLVAELARRKILLEICPTSNVLAGIYPSFAAHPLRALYDAGVPICLNSDDPGLFNTSIGKEYQVAQDHFGFTDRELIQMTKNAIKGSFADAATKQTLMERVRAFEYSGSLPHHTLHL
jgi:adenosine deaminase